MTQLYRVESATEMGDYWAVVLVNQNAVSSLHMVESGLWDRFIHGEAVLPGGWLPQHERMGALPPRWQQKVDLFTARRETA